MVRARLAWPLLHTVPKKIVLLHEPRFLWFGRMNRLQNSPRWGHS